MRALDILGQDISVGSFVAYSITKSHSSRLKVGKVLAITFRQDSDGTYLLDWEGNPLPKLKVRCIESDYHGKLLEGLYPRNQSIDAMERVMVIPSPPVKYLDLFTNAGL